MSVCEIHTGPFAHAFHERQIVHIGDKGVRQSFEEELRKVADAGERISNAGMQFNAGHALNYLNVGYIARCPASASCTSATRSSAGPCSWACARRCGK